jgi:hypothetical protein
MLARAYILPCAKEKRNTEVADEILRCAQNDKDQLCSLASYSLELDPYL